MQNNRYLTCPKDDELLECVSSRLKQNWGEFILTCPKCKKRFLRRIKYINQGTEVERSTLTPVARG